MPAKPEGTSTSPSCPEPVRRLKGTTQVPGTEVLPGVEALALTEAEERRAERIQQLAERIVRDFLQINMVVLVFIGAVALIDLGLLVAGYIAADQRVIGERTLVALIAGATVQCGALALAVVRGLFGGRGPRA